MDKFRSRKFILAMFIALISSLGLFLGKLDGSNFTTIASTLMTAYGFSNAAEYFAKTKEAETEKL